MSDDDDFGDFAEAVPETIEVQIDSAGRPLCCLPSVEFVAKDLSSCLACLNEGENVEFETFDCRFRDVLNCQDFKNNEKKEDKANSPRLKHMNQVVSLMNSNQVVANDFHSDNFNSNFIADLLVKQGEVFCREIWPSLSIRNIFFRHCNINETLNTANDTLPVMTEMDAEPVKTFTTETKKMTAKDILGNEVPDLSFMLASNIQWPPEYLNQI